MNDLIEWGVTYVANPIILLLIFASLADIADTLKRRL